jgi:dTMP kinase
MVKNLETPLAPKTEFLLYAADRAQHMHEIVKLALTEKKLIISDRMADSSVVYQGYARDLDINLIQQVNAWAMDNIVPDFTLFIDFDPKVAVQRTREKEQANNKSFFCSDPDLYYMQRAANGYHELFKNRKDVITLDGTHTPQELAQQAAKIIDKWLLKNNVYEQ